MRFFQYFFFSDEWHFLSTYPPFFLNFMRFFLFISSLFFLASCSLPGTQSEPTVLNTVLFDTPEFSTSVPKNWKKADARSLPIPPHGTLAMAMISKEIQYGFSNNYVIMEDELKMPITSKKYSELNHIQTTKNYLEYTKLEEQEITFSDTDISLLYVFEARYNKTTPLMKFIQTAKVCGTRVYLLHASIGSRKLANNYIELFKTFRCK